MQELILGSASKWRKKVLDDAGYHFRLMSADIDERAIRRGDAVDLTVAIAKAKAEAIGKRFYRTEMPDWDPLVITADQVVQITVGTVVGVLEKPVNEDDARFMLRSYSELGFCETVSAVVVTRLATGEQIHGVDIVRIAFDPIPEGRIAAAVARGVVMGSCGALVHEDPDIAPFIKKVYGPKDSVDGMPLFLLERLLAPFREEGAA